jgi:hypothetical protein
LISKGIIDKVTQYPFPGQFLKLADSSWSNKADDLAVLLRMAFPTNNAEMH